jgi:hypothetical protein
VGMLMRSAQFQIPKLKTIKMHICRVRNKVKGKHKLDSKKHNSGYTTGSHHNKCFGL